jgi:type II secretory pathway pseudopilin PulG
MNKQQTTRGMSLLEMTFASVIFMVIIVSIFPLIDGMLGRFQMARDHYIAASICQSRIERARMAPFSDLTLFNETTNNPSYLDDFGIVNPDGRFKRITIVSTNSPSNGLCTMTTATFICICSRSAWRKTFHPIHSSSFSCRFTEEKEEMSYIYTAYNQ